MKYLKYLFLCLNIFSRVSSGEISRTQIGLDRGAVNVKQAGEYKVKNKLKPKKNAKRKKPRGKGSKNNKLNPKPA